MEGYHFTCALHITCAHTHYVYTATYIIIIHLHIVQFECCPHMCNFNDLALAISAHMAKQESEIVK